MVRHKAQNFTARSRTGDVKISEDIDFKSMLLPQPILEGLKKCGYMKPSPIQQKALPLVRCGLDLIVQAKSGTGKTCVFTVAILELVKPNLPHLQAIVLAPTREIALQITSVINSIGQCVKGLKVGCFIGGYPLSNDVNKVKGCHVAVGAPGRMKHLLEKGLLNPHHVRLFVLDEVDKLMEEVFIKDINDIFHQLPDSKQVLACSATYSNELVELITRYMNGGQYVSPQQTVSPAVLLGMRQFVSIIPYHVDRLAQLKLKEKHLLYLLQSVSFNQCLIFSNLHTRAMSLCNLLRGEGWGVEWIAGRQKQKDRVAALTQLRDQRVRVLVTTDLTARGIDVENVNMVINLDLPTDHQTYLHRMGRAGRYGSHGIVITMVSNKQELTGFQELVGEIGGNALSVNIVPQKLKNIDLWTMSDDKFEKVFGIVEKKDSSTSLKSEDSSTSTDEKCSSESSDSEDYVQPYRPPESIDSEDNAKPYHPPDSSDSKDYVKEYCGENGVDPTNGCVRSAGVASVAAEGLQSVTAVGNHEGIFLSGDIYAKNASVTPDDAGDSTSTDEKISRGSSESEESTNNCDEQKPITSENSCTCNLYKPEDGDVKVIAGPSLFALKKEQHWREVLPVVVNESKVPLNTPIALLDSKLIRVRFWDKTQSCSRDINVNIPCKEVINFDSKCDSKDFLSFKDVVYFLENGVRATDPFASENTDIKLLSYENIEQALESGFCEVDGRILIKSNDIEQVLTKYNVIKEKSESALISFDSFDLVGWLAVDELHNIVEEIDIEKCDVFEFKLVTCLAGKNHIEVLCPPKGESKEAHDYIDHITTLKVDKFPLSTPISLSNIAQQIAQVTYNAPGKLIGDKINTHLKSGKNNLANQTLEENHKCDISSISEKQNSLCSETKMTSLLESCIKVPIFDSNNIKGTARKSKEYDVVIRQNKSHSSSCRSAVTSKKSNHSCSHNGSKTKSNNKNNERKVPLENDNTSHKEQVKKCDKKATNKSESFPFGDVKISLIEKSQPQELLDQRKYSGSYINMTWNPFNNVENLESIKLDSNVNNSELQSQSFSKESISVQESLGAKPKILHKSKSKSQDKNKQHNGFEHTRKHRNSDDSYDSFDTVEYETTDLDKKRQYKVFIENGTQRKHHHAKHEDSTNDSLKESCVSHEYHHNQKLTKPKVPNPKPYKQDKSKHQDPRHKHSSKECYNTHSSLESECSKPQPKLSAKVSSKREQKSKNRYRHEVRHNAVQTSFTESYGFNSIESEISKLRELNSKLHKQDEATRRHQSHVRDNKVQKELEDDDDSVESGGTNRHSFRTACSQHVSEEDDYLFDWDSSNSSCWSYHFYKSPSEMPPQMFDDQVRPRVTGCSYRSQFGNSFQGREEPEEGFPQEHQFSQSEFTCYPNKIFDHIYGSFRNSNYRFEDIPNLPARGSSRIRGENLHEEWYVNWYQRIRQRAEQVAMMEYINTMSTP